MSCVDTELELVEVTRADGCHVRCFVETPRSGGPEDPLVIIIPPYGKSMRELLTTSLYLSCNGFSSWRFDLSNHIGASDGQIFDFSLSSAVEDVKAVLDVVRKTSPRRPIGVVSSSLGTRAALRALKVRDDVDVLVSLVGVINVRSTLMKILGEDLVAERLNGRPLPVERDVLGYQISARFVHDLVDQDLFSLNSTKHDLSECRFPVVHIAAELDAWTVTEEVKEVFSFQSVGPHRELYLLSGSTHKLENNPSSAREALRLTVKILKQHLANQEISMAEICCPDFSEVVATNRRERLLEKHSDPTSYSRG